MKNKKGIQYPRIIFKVVVVDFVLNPYISLSSCLIVNIITTDKISKTTILIKSRIINFILL